MQSPKLVPLLTDGERESLEELVRKRTGSQPVTAWNLTILDDLHAQAPQFPEPAPSP
jgi:U3 small nucleolar ribonucleoprotein component